MVSDEMFEIVDGRRTDVRVIGKLLVAHGELASDEHHYHVARLVSSAYLFMRVNALRPSQ